MPCIIWVCFFINNSDKSVMCCSYWKAHSIFSFGKVCPKKCCWRVANILPLFIMRLVYKKRVVPLCKLFCTVQACSPAAQKIKGLSLSMTTKSGRKFFLQNRYLFKIFLLYTSLHQTFQEKQYFPQKALLSDAMGFAPISNNSAY